VADDATRAFARSLYRLRTAQGRTQKQLAAAAGVSQRAVSYIEAGRAPALPTAQALATALGTTVTAMITEADPGPGGTR